MRMTSPFAFDLPRWLTLEWTLRDVLDVVGSDTEIQYQSNRLADPMYETCSHNHRQLGRFSQFIAEVETGAANDVYLIAQNSDHPQTAQALQPILSLCHPVPEWLLNSSYNGFIWLGRGTMTPLHYDNSYNTMCQVIGEKHVRMFGPDQTDRLDPTTGVHSSLGWVSDDVVSHRSLAVHDVFLRPGRGVYIPTGWWHCVRTPDISMTVVFAQ